MITLYRIHHPLVTSPVQTRPRLRTIRSHELPFGVQLEHQALSMPRRHHPLLDPIPKEDLVWYVAVHQPTQSKHETNKSRRDTHILTCASVMLRPRS